MASLIFLLAVRRSSLHSNFKIGFDIDHVPWRQQMESKASTAQRPQVQVGKLLPNSSPRHAHPLFSPCKLAERFQPEPFFLSNNGASTS